MLPKSKILITKFPLYSSLGGVEKHTFQLVDALKDQGCQFGLLSSCHVMLSEFKKRGWWAKRWWLGLAPVNKWTKFLFFLGMPFFTISSFFMLWYLKRKYGFNKLYCLSITEKLIMTPLACLFGYKVFWLEHLSVDPVITANIYSPIYRAWAKLKCVELIAISNFVKWELANIGIYKTKVIYHGIDAGLFKKQENIFSSMANRRFQFDKKSTFRVGTVSRLEKIKGLEYLIRAMAHLKENEANIDLVIVGEGSERQKLQWLIDQLDLRREVKLVGYQDNFLDWIYDFDIFVLPSIKESLGIVLLEAMACGKPVVATNVGGVPEIVEHGKDGILVQVASPATLAEGIEELKNNKDKWRDLVSAGRKTVEQKFTFDKMIAEYKKELIS